MAAADFYLPDECWECIFEFLIFEFNSLSLVSKQFLSITNHLQFSLTIRVPTRHRLSILFQRFPNLTSLNLTCVRRFPFHTKLICSKGFCWISSLASSLVMGFVACPQLKSLLLNNHSCLKDESITNFASIFPNLEMIDMSYCRNITEVHICQVLRRFSNIRYLNLTGCLGWKLRVMNFEVPNLEVLNLSYTDVDEEALYVISKCCHGLLKLLLEGCDGLTEKGVKYVVENCTQLREINLRHCHHVHSDVLSSLILSRPSLRKIKSPQYHYFSHRETELLSLQGCIVC